MFCVRLLAVLRAYAAAQESEIGTKLPIQKVRYSVAIRGKADRFFSIWAVADLADRQHW